MSILELRDLALSVAQEAGEMILEKRLGQVEVAGTKSTVNDVVTQVDRDAEELIKNLLLSARPNDGFFGEEGGSGQSTSGVTWVVDPIDGTVNFLYGIPHFAVSIAAIEGPPDPYQWRVVTGVVLNPVMGELYSAAEGNGAFLNEREIHVAPAVPMGNALLLTGFAYAERYRQAQGELIQEILPRVRDIRRLGTASLDLAYVAAGRANVYFERTLSPWDHAAGELIVREAGGVVTGFGDTAPGREAIFAGERDMVAQMKELVSEFGGDQPLSRYDS